MIIKCLQINGHAVETGNVPPTQGAGMYVKYVIMLQSFAPHAHRPVWSPQWTVSLRVLSNMCVCEPSCCSFSQQLKSILPLRKPSDECLFCLIIPAVYDCRVTVFTCYISEFSTFSTGDGSAAQTGPSSVHTFLHPQWHQFIAWCIILFFFTLKGVVISHQSPKVPNDSRKSS